MIRLSEGGIVERQRWIKKEKMQRWKEIQDLARLVIKENGGYDIRFIKEGSVSSSIDNKDQEA